MEIFIPVFIAVVTLIQTIATEALRRQGQASALRCAKCGSSSLTLRPKPDTDRSV